jgi:hypothetical protein
MVTFSEQSNDNLREGSWAYSNIKSKFETSAQMRNDSFT